MGDEGHDPEGHLVQRYLDEVARQPQLSDEDIAVLARRCRAGDHAAGRALVQANLRLVVEIAQDFQAAGAITLLDLVQEGNIGLMKAVDRYDPDGGVRFPSYAARWINQAIRDALGGHPAGVSSSTESDLQVAWDLLVARLGRQPTLDELAAEARHPAIDVADILQSPQGGDGRHE